MSVVTDEMVERVAREWWQSDQRNNPFDTERDWVKEQKREHIRAVLEAAVATGDLRNRNRDIVTFDLEAAKRKLAVCEELTDEVTGWTTPDALDLARSLIAALTAAIEQGGVAMVPEGWVMVPKEATQEIITAYMKMAHGIQQGDIAVVKTEPYAAIYWRAMLAAAPSHQTSDMRPEGGLTGAGVVCSKVQCDLKHDQFSAIYYSEDQFDWIGSPKIVLEEPKE